MVKTDSLLLPLVTSCLVALDSFLGIAFRLGFFPGSYCGAGATDLFVGLPIAGLLEDSVNLERYCRLSTFMFVCYVNWNDLGLVDMT